MLSATGNVAACLRGQGRFEKAEASAKGCSLKKGNGIRRQ